MRLEESGEEEEGEAEQMAAKELPAESNKERDDNKALLPDSPGSACISI